MSVSAKRSTNWCSVHRVMASVIFGVLVANVASIDTMTTTQNALQSSTTDANSKRDRSGIPLPAMSVSTRNAPEINLCPNMVHYVYEGATPRDDLKSGRFEEFAPGDTEMGEEVDIRACLVACCKKPNNTCNVVFVFKRKCYHVQCSSNEACLPKAREQVKERLQMILVSPVRSAASGDDENLTWLDVLKSTKSTAALIPLEEEGGNNPLSFWKQSHKFHYPERSQDSTAYDEDDFPIAEKRMKQLLLSSAAAAAAEESDSLTPEELAYYGANLSPDSPVVGKYIPCDLEMSELSGNRCPPKEQCVPRLPNSASGVCKCMHGFVRQRRHGECLPQEMDYPLLEESAAHTLIMPASAIDSNDEPHAKNTDEERTSTAGTDTNKKLMVSVVSKEVRLPEKEVTLAAFTVPDEESSNTKYKYLWSLISQPKGPMNGTISDQSKSKVKLSNLSEGLYTFKVTVTGENGMYGEAMANVTVLPEKRINHVPQVVITPSVQTIRQPTTNAVLDGSTSSDDDKIASWHWEVIQGPIGYQPKLSDVATLQLTDLTSPGNYTFKLTVTDTDNVTNSTTANITVLKGTDYPPVANAGDAVILYLPNNNVTLNGTASSDDHEIVAWEWTKDASDETKAVDMQNTRTPYVQLSNLEEGMYTFVLKVTDGSGQSSTAKVHVFVKPPTNSPPVAKTKGNATISLPQNWVVLDGSESVDDIGIELYQWKQLIGPNTASIRRANESVANATALTLGLYKFELSVFDENNNTASDSMWVKVVQEKNAPPVANAGGDQSVTLPISALYLNGSKSSDDLAVVKFSWTRDETSLAAGRIVGNTDNEPVLILTNLVHGRYVFKLTVSDDQGLTSSDTVSVIVHPDPMLMHLVELTLPMGVSVLTQADLNSVVQKIGLLLGDMKVIVRELKYDTRSEATILVFYVETTDKDNKPVPVNGLKIEQLLKEKLQRDASMLGTVFVDVRSTVCQNTCSGHGVCNTETRACICEAFWMPSVGYLWGMEEANCEWSILYVFVGIIVGFLLLSGIFWSIACACRRSRTSTKKRSRPKVQKYSLIGTHDEEAPHSCRTTSFTDSETDSDVLFETRTKSNGILRMNGSSTSSKMNNGGQNKYPNKKIGRKIKA